MLRSINSRSINALKNIGNSLNRRTLITSSRIGYGGFNNRNNLIKVNQSIGSKWHIRNYSDHGALTKDQVQARIIDVLESFDKVTDVSKLTPNADFEKDLGLDSLDVVEVLFFVEEEFCILIPDHEADEIHTIEQATKYILEQHDGRWRCWVEMLVGDIGWRYSMEYH